MSPTVAPYGSWSSPISAQLLVAGAVSLGEVWVGDAATWWAELRPEEGGRVQLVRREDGGVARDVLPDGFSARTRVHEYGGAAWWVHDGSVFFANWADQRLYRVDPGSEPLALTTSPEVPQGLRYADGRVTPGGGWVVCVRERHQPGREAANEIVALPAGAPAADASAGPALAGGPGGGAVSVLAAGRDFVAAPRVSRDGRMLAWLTWDHPNMPWDGTELWIARLVERDGRLETTEARRVAGGPQESLVQPEWGRHGQLYVLSDRSDWWNLYRVEDPDDLAPVAAVAADVGQPAWVFGQSRYGFTPDGTVVFTYSSGGAAHLGLARPGDPVTTVPLPYTSLTSLQVEGERVTALGAAADHEPVVVRIGTGRLLRGADPVGEEIEVLRAPRDLGLDPGLTARARPIAFPTAGGAPRTPTTTPPPTRPIGRPTASARRCWCCRHGGPTSAASPAYSLGIQFWTSRGFAVVDVDYGGIDRLRPGLPPRGSTARGASSTSTTACAAAAALAARGPCRPRAAGHPRRLRRRVHHAGRPGLSRRVPAGGEPLRRGRPRARWPATPTSSSRATSTASSGPGPRARPSTPSARRSTTSTASRPIILLPGPRGRDRAAGPGRDDGRALRAKGIPVAYLAFEGEQHGFRRAENILAGAEAELYFYSRVFGFELADPVEPVDIAFAERLA